MTTKGEITGERLRNLWAYALSVVHVLRIKNPKYGDSWKQYGGYSAFMNLARKWSRIEHLASQHNYDIFAAIMATKGQPDGMEESLRDLEGYGLLILEDQSRCDADFPVVDQVEVLMDFDRKLEGT